jgi:hypothetical protein
MAQSKMFSLASFMDHMEALKYSDIQCFLPLISLCFVDFLTFYLITKCAVMCCFHRTFNISGELPILRCVILLQNCSPTPKEDIFTTQRTSLLFSIVIKPLKGIFLTVLITICFLSDTQLFSWNQV